MNQAVGLYLVAERHIDAIQKYASDYAIAATTRIPHPYPEHGAREFVELMTKSREEGREYAFAIEDAGTFVGISGLHSLSEPKKRELGYWIAKPFWGRGYATFAVRWTLEFAFRNLQLREIHANVCEGNLASCRVLEKNGFRCHGLVPRDVTSSGATDRDLVVYDITCESWREFTSAPALAKLHPQLKAILDAELQFGNQIIETGSGWPDKDSIFIRLRDPFHAKHEPLPRGITYLELNDPHWWKAEFSSQSPRHILAY